MPRKSNNDEPTLTEAWQMLADRWQLSVEEVGERSIRATGTVRGRPLSIEIDGGGARSEFGRFFFGLNTKSSRNRRETWRTVVTVGCRNPSGATGAIESAVDVRDPAWNPREYNPRNGRKITAKPPTLAQRALTPDLHERLMSVQGDVVIHVDAAAIRIDDESTAIPGSGANYVAGSVVHHYQGSPQPWPQRAIAGPPWWIDLLCDIAETVDA